MDTRKKVFAVLVALIILVDLLVIPDLLLLAVMVKEQGSQAVAAWNYSPVESVRALFNPLVRTLWGWAQFMVVAAIIYIWSLGVSTLRNLSGQDAPPAAGHGQHGTSRWMTQEEIKSVFTLWHIGKGGD